MDYLSIINDKRMNSYGFVDFMTARARCSIFVYTVFYLDDCYGRYDILLNLTGPQDYVYISLRHFIAYCRKKSQREKIYKSQVKMTTVFVFCFWFFPKPLFKAALQQREETLFAHHTLIRQVYSKEFVEKYSPFTYNSNYQTRRLQSDKDDC